MFYRISKMSQFIVNFRPKHTKLQFCSHVKFCFLIFQSYLKHHKNIHNKFLEFLKEETINYDFFLKKS